MNERAKLIELICDNLQVDGCIAHCNYPPCDKCKTIADHLLANGVIVPPVKVGDKVYKIWNCGKHGKSVAEFVVKHIDIDYLPDIEVLFIKQNSTTGSYYFAKTADFGKTVFLSREDAEKALEERKEK